MRKVSACGYLRTLSRPCSGLAQRLPRLHLKRKEKKKEEKNRVWISQHFFSQFCFIFLHDDTLETHFHCSLYFLSSLRVTPRRRYHIEALSDTSAGGTSRFVFRTSGSNAEAYLTRPKGPGPFPLMILLHGHTLWSMGGESVVSEAEGFASDLCYASLAVSLPGYGATKVPPGHRSKHHLEGSPGRGFFSQEASMGRFEAILSLRFLPWRILRRVAGEPT